MLHRAPFGLFYHAAWFTQPHHKEGFIRFLDNIVSMPEVWVVNNWQAIQWVRDPTSISRLQSFTPFHCDLSVSTKCIYYLTDVLVLMCATTATQLFIYTLNMQF